MYYTSAVYVPGKVAFLKLEWALEFARLHRIPVVNDKGEEVFDGVTLWSNYADD